jgi:putative ABC transport system permease protein
VPQSWRETVLRDIEDEAAAHGKSGLWVAAQVLGVGIRLRPAVTGDMVMSDVRYTLRSLARSKTFALGAVTVFAVGIGINIATFAAVDRVLFRSLPFTESDRLVQLRMCNRESGECGGGFFPAVIEEAGTLTTIGRLAIVAFTERLRIDGADDETPPLLLHQSSMNLLDVLGVQPAVGRNVSAEEARVDARVAMLSHETWQLKFAGAQDILARQLRTSDGPVPIIGVLPKGFVAPAWVAPSGAWDGLVFYATPMPLAPIARLSPGASPAQAAAEIETLVATLEPRLRDPRRPAAEGPLPYIRVELLESTLFENSAEQAALVAAAAALVLLLASANLAGLMLTRGRSRERELALRVALGASRLRIVTATLVEAGVLCLAGTTVAVFALIWGGEVVRSLLPPLMARYTLAGTDWRAVTVAIVASLVCTVLAGLWPGLRASRLRPTDALVSSSGSAGHRKVAGGRVLLGLEAAFGVVLVLAAVGTARSFSNLLSEGVGLDPRGLYAVRLTAAPGTPPAPRLTPAEQLTNYHARLAQSRTLPGVIGVAGADSVVGTGSAPLRGFSRDQSMRGGRYEVSAGYFALLGTRPVAGREFTDAEVGERANLAILNAAGVQLVWPGSSPASAVGRTMTLPGDVPRVVVGVVPAQRLWYGAAETAAVFVPLGSEPAVYGGWLVRLADDAPDTVAAFREALAAATGQRVTASSVSESYSPGLSEPRFRAVMLGTFALSGLVIAAAGIFAMTAFGVTIRRREMGVRLALGATPVDLVRLVIREALVPVAVGAALGVTCALVAADRLQVLLYRADARDPGTALLVCVVLLTTAVIAAWVPARRAGRVDPATVLRSQ